MADKFLNNTGLAYYHSRIKQEFASQTDLDALDQRVDDIVAEGGEPNVIEIVKVNNVALTPDAQKAVNVTVPTTTSELTNDGDGTTPFATTATATTSAAGLMSATDKTKLDSVTADAEPNTIETVKVNGTALVPDAQKAVDVSVPTVSISVDGTAGSGRYRLTSGETYAQFVIDPETNSVALTLDDGEEGYGIGLPTSAYLESVLPTATSDLTNDGDGTSPFATQAYVQQNGGKIDTISVNNVQQTITNKNVNITVPTVVSDLTNDSGYQNATQVQTAIDNALADITGIDFQVVQTLPATGEKGVIYLVANTGTTPNIYDEYIWIEQTGGSGTFEKIGTTEVDLSNYWTSTSGQNNSLIAITTAEIDTILAS